MKPNRSMVAAALLAAFVLSSTTANADRPDRPPVPLTIFTNETSGLGFVANDHVSGGLYVASSVMCAGLNIDSPAYMSVIGSLTDPDSVSNKSNKLGAKQSAYVQVFAEFYDGTNYSQSSPVKVASCKASWKISDGEKDLNYMTGAGQDIGSFSLSCGENLATQLGLDPAQTAMFNQGFPNGMSCKGKGYTAPGCFRGDTLVATEAGPRAIRDVRVGDKVWAWDEAQQKKVLARVSQTIVQPARDLRSLVADGEMFHVTDRHPFWVDGRGWVHASNVAAGDKLRTKEGNLIAVRSNERADALAFYAGYDASADRQAALRHPLFRIRAASTGAPAASDTGIVYNIEVEGLHNYYVGHKQVLVHNK
jgi:hypothetical protein